MKKEYDDEKIRIRSRQEYDRLRGGDPKSQNLQNEGAGSSSERGALGMLRGRSSNGSVRLTACEPLAVAIERLQAITNTTKNEAAQGIRISKR